MRADGKIIVGVFGTQNVGKTTFVNDVIKDGGGWTLFGNNYRDVIRESGLKINRDGDEESQKTIHGILMRNILDALNDGDANSRFIMDRTPVDSYAYTEYLHGKGKGDVSSETVANMKSDVEMSFGMYDCLLYIPLGMCGDIKVVDDRFRDTNLEYRAEIDGIMGKMFSHLSEFAAKMGWSVMMRKVYGTRERRIEMFREIIGELLKRRTYDD